MKLKISFEPVINIERAEMMGDLMLLERHKR